MTVVLLLTVNISILLVYVNIVVGDFNVDFDRGGDLASLLMANLGLVASDLCFCPSIGYNYESDSGLA